MMPGSNLLAVFCDLTPWKPSPTLTRSGSPRGIRTPSSRQKKMVGQGSFLSQHSPQQGPANERKIVKGPDNALEAWRAPRSLCRVLGADPDVMHTHARGSVAMQPCYKEVAGQATPQEANPSPSPKEGTHELRRESARVPAASPSAPFLNSTSISWSWELRPQEGVSHASCTGDNTLQREDRL